MAGWKQGGTQYRNISGAPIIDSGYTGIYADLDGELKWLGSTEELILHTANASASYIIVDNTPTDFLSTDVQGVIEEIDTDLDVINTDITNLSADVADLSASIVPVSISGGEGINVSGGYPDFAISVDDYISATEVANVSADLQSQISGISGVATDDFVNITGDTMTGTLEFGVSGIGVQFYVDGNDTNPAHSEGLIFYDNDEKAVSYYNEQNDVTINIGQETVVRVVNKTGSLIPNGSVVRINGAQGNRPTVDLVTASQVSSHETIGVTTHNIPNNTNGYVTVIGLVREVDTSSFSEGDTLYSSNVPGEFTNVEPPATHHKIQIGHVVTVDAVAGAILVDVIPYEELVELHDVETSSLTTNDFLVYTNDPSATWSNVAPSGVADLLAPEFADDFVSVTGNPIVNQLAIFGDTNVISGDDSLTWDGSSLAISGDLAVFTIAGSGDEIVILGPDGSLINSGTTIDALVTGLSGRYFDVFVEGDLSGGILNVSHNLNEKYVAVDIYDNNDLLIQPDDVELKDNNTLEVDLSSYGTIPGTWKILILSQGGQSVSSSAGVETINALDGFVDLVGLGGITIDTTGQSIGIDYQGSINDISGVSIFAPEEGDILVFQNGEFVNQEFTPPSSRVFDVSASQSLTEQGIYVVTPSGSNDVSLIIPDADLNSNEEQQYKFLLQRDTGIGTFTVQTSSGQLVGGENIQYVGQDNRGFTLLSHNGSWLLTQDNRRTSVFTYQSPELDNPNNSDWVVNALAPADADSNNSALTIRAFDDTTEEGVGYNFKIEDWATQLTVRIISRAGSTQNGNVVPAFYNRTLTENISGASLSSWSSAVSGNPIELFSNEGFVFSSFDLDLRDFDLNKEVQVFTEFTRQASNPLDTLIGDWFLFQIQLELN